jgi:glucose/arabinose dehydrogenase
VITWGHIYVNKMELAHPEEAGMEQPVANFEPSPGMGGLGVYTGNAFPKWKGDLFVGSLKQMDLFRIVLDGDREVLREVVLHHVGRFRQIKTGPDGLLWALTDDGTLMRLRPAPAR